MANMEDISKLPIDDGRKKKQWVKPEIRILAHDDPRVKYFQSLTDIQHRKLFKSQ